MTDEYGLFVVDFTGKSLNFNPPTTI